MINGNSVRFSNGMTGTELVSRLNDLNSEINDLSSEINRLKEYIVERELLSDDEVKPSSPKDDRLSFL